MSRSLKMLFVVVVVVTTSCWKLYVWKSTLGFTVFYAILAWLVAFVVNQQHKLKKCSMPMSPLILALTFVPLLSLITHFTEEKHNLMYNKNVWFASLTFLFYYVFHIKKISEEALLKFLIAMGFVTFVIQVVQQFVPNISMFGVLNEDNLSMDNAIRVLEKRNGLYRFRLGTYILTLLCMYFGWMKVQQSKNIRNLLFFFAFTASMYLFLTRQLMFASVVTFAVTSVFVKGATSRKIGVMLFSALVLFILYQNAELFLGDMIAQTKNEETDNNIRMIALEFYWGQIIRSPMALLLGNGHPSQLVDWMEYMAVYPSDIGVVGQWFYYGLFWVLTYVVLLYKILIKYVGSLPLYIKLFVFGTFVNCIMIMPYFNSFCYFVWAAVLYICDLHISKSSLRITNYSKI